MIHLSLEGDAYRDLVGLTNSRKQAWIWFKKALPVKFAENLLLLSHQ
jgi:hypothetical protein